MVAHDQTTVDWERDYIHLIQLSYSQPTTHHHTHLVDIPNTISGGNFVLFLLLFLSGSSLLRMSCVALNCACSCAVVSPDCTADLFSEMKSFSATFLWLGDLVGQ